jgi:uncharacterized damage-inducible protein DinB
VSRAVRAMGIGVDRRAFLRAATCVTAGAAGVLLTPAFESGAAAAAETSESATIIGPKKGFTPQIGTLTAMMAFMRSQVLGSVKGLKLADLDFLLDAKANTIGALLLHLAATETSYQLHTMQGMAWGAWPDAVKEKWDAASELGDAGRKAIKGNELEYYLNVLKETRERTLAEFKKRDDKWLFAVDDKWFWGPTNNYCKWFHVCEHEANHNGQIKFLMSRLPRAAGAKEGGGG